MQLHGCHQSTIYVMSRSNKKQSSPGKSGLFQICWRIYLPLYVNIVKSKRLWNPCSICQESGGLPE
jgi:hypothetical protein